MAWDFIGLLIITVVVLVPIAVVGKILYSD